jgi:hypothetical protein
LLNFKGILINICKKATGQYLAVDSNGRESRKITQLLHPTVAA